MDMDVDSPLALKAKQFLEARKYSENLKEILTCLENADTAAEVISLIQLIFMEILKRRTMLISYSEDQKDASVSDYIIWLKEAYENVWKRLIHMMSDKVFGGQATCALFNLLGQEGKFPIIASKKGVYYFPEIRLKVILKKMFATHSNSNGVQEQVDTFTDFIDVAYHFWLVSPKILANLKNLNDKLMSHILDCLQRIPIPSDYELKDLDENLLLCFTKGKPKFRPKYSILQESIQILWNIILNWKCSSNNHKKVLILLLENIMPHLLKPILTMDYLMESLNTGGTVSLLALQGIFVLVKDHNLEYPNIYGKLYSFFHPSIFYTKYKTRLYMLANIFLSSTHLPETLIASFVKRFSRLCLCAPPQDIIVLSAFIGNLLIRHSNLKIMIQHPVGKSVPADPFLDHEEDPYKTKAIESSLWELETLQQHVLPKVSKAVSFINKPLPNTECDLASLIEISYDQIFEKESKKNMQKVSLTFEEPESFTLPRTNHFSNFWSFDDQL